MALGHPVRQIHRAGKTAWPRAKLFADYAGPSIPIIDADTGEIRPASIFVAVLGASSHDRRKSLWDRLNDPQTCRQFTPRLRLPADD